MAHGKSAFNFIVEIDGAGVAGFSEVDALTSDGNVIEYREGDGTAHCGSSGTFASSIILRSSAAILTVRTFGTGGSRSEKAKPIASQALSFCSMRRVRLC